MPLNVSSLSHCGPCCHPGCCSPLWGSRAKLARLKAGFYKLNFVHSLPVLDWFAAGFNPANWFRLLRGASYGAPRGRTICMPKEIQTARDRKPHLCSWLLILFVSVFFHVESEVYVEWNSGYSCPVFVVIIIIIIFLGDAGMQFMRLSTSSVSVGGLHTVPRVVLCSFTGKPHCIFSTSKSPCHFFPKMDRTCCG